MAFSRCSPAVIYGSSLIETEVPDPMARSSPTHDPSVSIHTSLHSTLLE